MIIQIDIADLRAVVREEVEQALRSVTDRPISRREAAAIRGCTERGIDAMIRRGELKRLPGPGQVRVSLNEVRGNIDNSRT